MANGASSFVGIATIVKELRSLRELRFTGTYYIVSSDNRQVRLGMSAGEVTGISLRTQNLSSALDIIAGLQIIRTNFAKDGLAVAGGAFDLTTDEIIRGLAHRCGQPTPATPAAPAAGVHEGVSDGISLSPSQDVALRRLFIEHIGPIGEFVYDEHRETSDTPKKLLAGLAREIPDPRNADRFLAQAKSILLSTR